jgi:hypothetical protein
MSTAERAQLSEIFDGVDEPIIDAVWQASSQRLDHAMNVLVSMQATQLERTRASANATRSLSRRRTSTRKGKPTSGASASAASVNMSADSEVIVNVQKSNGELCGAVVCTMAEMSAESEWLKLLDTVKARCVANHLFKHAALFDVALVLNDGTLASWTFANRPLGAMHQSQQLTVRVVDKQSSTSS